MRKNPPMVFLKENRICENFSQTLNCEFSKNFLACVFEKSQYLMKNFANNQILFSRKIYKEYLRNDEFRKYNSLKFFRKDKFCVFSKFIHQDWWLRNTVFERILYKNFEIRPTYISKWNNVIQVMKPVVNDDMQRLGT